MAAEGIPGIRYSLDLGFGEKCLEGQTIPLLLLRAVSDAT